MALEKILSRYDPSQRVLFVHDMWTHKNQLGLGDVDDSVNVFWLARRLKHVFIYIVNDTGDHRRYKGFMKYYHVLKDICPTIQFLYSGSTFPSVDKIVLCAPLHAEHDKRMVEYVRTYTPGRLLYGQGDSARAYNVSSSALFPYMSFGEQPTLLTETHAVPITLYNTNATNRKITVDLLSEITCPELTTEVLLYAKHKLCFLPEKPFAVGLLLKKYGTGNTAYGLCHAKNWMMLHDMTDPDTIIQKHMKDEDAEHLVCDSPTVHQYFITMCCNHPDKLSSTEDQKAFMRALALVTECTLEWFGKKALEERFRTLADDDVTAKVDGSELYSPSMFDLMVGVAAVHDLTPDELATLLPGNPNELMTGPFMELLHMKIKKD